MQLRTLKQQQRHQVLQGRRLQPAVTPSPGLESFEYGSRTHMIMELDVHVDLAIRYHARGQCLERGDVALAFDDDGRCAAWCILGVRL